MQKSAKTIVVFTRVPTHPPRAGNQVRILSLAEAIQRVGYELHFVVLAPVAPSSEFLEQVALMRAHWGAGSVSIIQGDSAAPGWGKRLFAKFRQMLARMTAIPALWPPKGADDWMPVGVADKLKQLLRELQPYALQVEYLWDSWALDCSPVGCLRIIDTHDVFSNRHHRLMRAGQVPSWFYTSPGEERRGLMRADRIIAIQEEEGRYFESLTGRSVVTVGHLLDSITGSAPVADPVVGFLGSGNVVNQAALQWFIGEVWPQLRARVPSARLEVFGGICKELSPRDGIVLQGSVENLLEAYQRMAVVVAPLRFGTGLKIKCIEALAYGKALVTTSSGAEGLAHGGGDHLCIADTAEAFANAVADLLVNVERRGQLEHNALGFARRWQDQQMQAVRKLYQPLQVAGL